MSTPSAPMGRGQRRGGQSPRLPHLGRGQNITKEKQTKVIADTSLNNIRNTPRL